MGSQVVLVTGGAGFIGSHLVEFFLRQGWRVVVIDNLSSGHFENLPAHKVRFVRADVSRAETFKSIEGEKISLICHFAGNANVPLSVSDPEHDFVANMVGTFRVLEFARRHEVSKLLFASSASVCGITTALPLAESMAPNPVSPYAASKAAGECYAISYYRAYGIPATVVRLFNVFGPRCRKFVVYDFFQKLRANSRELAIIGDGLQARDFLFVEDAIRGLVLLADEGKPGEVYNLASGTPTTIRELAGMIIEEMGLNEVAVKYTLTPSPGDIPRWYAEISKIRALGFVPRVSLRDGLRTTVAWLKENA